MDQDPSGESEHGLRADSALYLHHLLQWNVLRGLCTAESLLHTSYSFSGSWGWGKGDCRNNEIIIPIIPSNGGNEIAFVLCSRLQQLRRFHPISRATFARGCWNASAQAVLGCTCWRTKTTTDPGYPWTAEILNLGNFTLARAQHVPPSPSKHTPCPT